MSLSRRQFNASLAVAAASLVLPRRSLAAEPAKWLLFTKSSGFIHDVIKRNGDEPSYLAAQLTPRFAERGLTLIESKDGRLFEPDSLKQFAGFVFYTTDDLTEPGKDGQPPISAAGKQLLFDTVAAGTPFIGLHCASDTWDVSAGEPPTDYTKMLGGEFDSHGDQQPSTARIVDPNFPGVGQQSDWAFTEEWYATANLQPDIHPIHLLETKGMKGKMYDREPYPITWTRLHGRGRVFYTAMGHREDVIASKAYQNLIGGAIEWCRG